MLLKVPSWFEPVRPRWSATRERLGRSRRRFRDWRRRQPFSGALLLVLSGLMILIPPYASFRVGDMAIAIGTVSGVSSVLIGGLLVTIGVALWLRPEFRVIGGIAGGLLALVSFVTTNLGGLVVGMLLGLVGAAALLAWTDQPRSFEETEPSVPSGSNGANDVDDEVVQETRTTLTTTSGATTLEEPSAPQDPATPRGSRE